MQDTDFLLTCQQTGTVNPSDQTQLLIYSGQNHFLINFGSYFISSCAEPTKTLTKTVQRCHFMNIQSQKISTLPKVTSILPHSQHFSPRLPVSSLSWACPLHCPLNELIWFYLLCINIQVKNVLRALDVLPGPALSC